MLAHVPVEKFIEKLDITVYPITIIKFLLNKRRILSYFRKLTEDNFEIRGNYRINNDNCEACKTKADQGILCRQHTSLQRVMTASKVGYDLDTNVYFYQNEIFRMVDNNLAIIYCPHPKLISGDITDSKVRKINYLTIQDPELTALPVFEQTQQFISSELLDQSFKCWFNNEFSIITVPHDRHNQNWVLTANK